jgi:ribosomal protein L40E
MSWQPVVSINAFREGKVSVWNWLYRPEIRMDHEREGVGMSLEDAEAPEDVSEGWKPDPIGASDWRWWDGTAWTDRVGTSQQASPSASVESPNFTAPNKVCPHCGASAQTTANKCPNCGKGYKKRTGLKIFVGICVAGLVLVVGCTALLAGGVNEAVKELDAEQAEHAITRSEFKALEIGMTQQQVIDSTGKAPEDRQNFESEGFLSEEPTTSTCIYYNQADGEFLDTYQLCFDNGRLTSKNAW